MWGWLKKSLTGPDNQTYDPARLSWAYSVGAITVAAGIQAWKGVTVDLMQLASALGFANAAGAGATLATNKSQPQPKETADASTTTTTSDSQGMVSEVAVETNSHST